MQESTAVGWDPITSCYTTPPWYVKVYILYLLVFLGASFVRSILLARSVWSPRERQLSSQDHGEPNVLAKVALQGSLAYAPAQNGGQLPVAPAEDSSLGDRALDRADARFTFLWQLSNGRVRSMKRGVLLTLLFGVLVTVVRVENVLYGISMQKSTSQTVIGASLAEVFTALAPGLLVCLLVYAASSLFEGVLARRRAHWTYFCESSKMSAAETEHTKP